jgi:hypothetical protein
MCANTSPRSNCSKGSCALAHNLNYARSDGSFRLFMKFAASVSKASLLHSSNWPARALAFSAIMGIVTPLIVFFMSFMPL